MSNLSYEDVIALWLSLPVVPEVKTSLFVPRGQAYQLTTTGRNGQPKLLMVVHPDDAHLVLGYKYDGA